MNTYYVAGLPYSDELWHYGTKGMKWGQRLYQNPDGTLTPLGKIHYGVKNAAQTAGRAAGNAIKRSVDNSVKNYKRKHPWTMTEEEIDSDIKRLKKEKELKDLYSTVRGKSASKRIMEKSGDVFYAAAKKYGEKFGENLAQKTVDRIAEKWSTTSRQKMAKRYKDLADLNNRQIEYEKSVAGMKRFRLESRASDMRARKEYTDRVKEYLTSSDNLNAYKKKRKAKTNK